MTRLTELLYFKGIKNVISYLGLWEIVNNPNFKRVEFDTFKNESDSNKFKISPQKKFTFIRKHSKLALNFVPLFKKTNKL